jgi:hypothetical protein
VGTEPLTKVTTAQLKTGIKGSVNAKRPLRGSVASARDMGHKRRLP